MNAVITGDVHLGSRALDAKPFIKFLQDFPDGEWLILNGDVVNRHCKKLPPEHEAALDELRILSLRARVTWIRGNHDEAYVLTDPAKIEFIDFCLIEDGVAILHGHDFRHKNLSNRPLVYVLRAIQSVRKHFVSEPACVNYNVWDRHILVRTLRRHMINNAFALAKEHNLHTVICGHIHIPERLERDDVSYINTGSWLTSRPDGESICLKRPVEMIQDIN